MLPLKVLAALLLVTTASLAQEPPEPVPLDRKGEVSITIKGAPVQSVIESIVINGNYDFVTSGEFADTVNLSLTGVSIREALDTLTQITTLEYRVEGRIVTLYGKATPSEFTRIYKLGIASATQLAPQISALVGGGAEGAPAPSGPASAFSALAAPFGAEAAAASGATGQGPVIVDRVRNQLIVTAKPSVHRRVEKVIATLDVPQAGETARFRIFELKYIPASLFKEAIKFQLPGFSDAQYLVLSAAGGAAAAAAQSAGADAGAGAAAGGAAAGGDSAGGGASAGVSASSAGTSNTRRVLISETERNLDYIAKLLDQLDRPLKQIYAEISLMKISRSDRDQFGAGLRGLVTQAGRTTPLAEFFSNLGSGAANMQLRFGTIGPEQFSVLFDYLKSKQRGEVIASPRLLVQEGQEAKINITQQFPVFETQVLQGVPISRVTFTDVGTIVSFTPSVFADGTIRLSINPEISNVLRTISVGNQGEVPVKDSNIISTVLNVSDGHTAIIGGLKTQNLSKTFDSQPLLGRIPLIGRLFHRHSDSNEVNDLIFTLTPKIVGTKDYMLDSGKPDESAASLQHRFLDSGRIGTVIFEDRLLTHFYNKGTLVPGQADL